MLTHTVYSVHTGSNGKAILSSTRKSYFPPFCLANGVEGDLVEN